MTGRSALLFLLLVATASAATMDKKTVSVKLFYEADCPDCRIFFKDQLGPLWEEDKEGILQLHDINSIQVNNSVPIRCPRNRSLPVRQRQAMVQFHDQSLGLQVPARRRRVQVAGNIPEYVKCKLTFGIILGVTYSKPALSTRSSSARRCTCRR